MLQLLACGSIAQTTFIDGDIHYRITSDTTAAVIRPASGGYTVSGLTIPEVVTNSGNSYRITSIAD